MWLRSRDPQRREWGSAMLSCTVAAARRGRTEGAVEVRDEILRGLETDREPDRIRPRAGRHLGRRGLDDLVVHHIRDPVARRAVTVCLAPASQPRAFFLSP